MPYSPTIGGEKVQRAVILANQFGGFELLSRDQMDLQESIDRASLVIAVMTDVNPVVMLEIGYALAANKPLRLITQDPGNIPFGLEPTRMIVYHPGFVLSVLVTRLVVAISAIVADATDADAPSKPEARDKVFFSYSHLDAAYLDRMLIHMRPVERSGAIDLWSDTKIKVGDL